MGSLAPTGEQRTTHPSPAWGPASRAKSHFSLVLQLLHSHRPPAACPARACGTLAAWGWAQQGPRWGCPWPAKQWRGPGSKGGMITPQTIIGRQWAGDAGREGCTQNHPSPPSRPPGCWSGPGLHSLPSAAQDAYRDRGPLLGAACGFCRG